MSVQLDGYDALQRAFARAPAVVEARSSVAVATTAATIATRARALVPVASGALHRSIAWSARGLSAEVGVDSLDVFYWIFVEFGTRYKSARPFFRPAAEAESDPFLQRMRDIGKALERDFTSGGVR